jgi:hypothetical protein
MSKPRGNCVLIEYRGVSAIYFNRGRDKFEVVVGRSSSTFRNTLKQARAFADTHGDPQVVENLGLLIAVEQVTFSINKRPERCWRLATLVAIDKYDQARVRYADGTVELTRGDVCVANGQEDVDKLNELRDAEERAESQYRAHQKMRKLPDTLEEIEKAVAAQRRALKKAGAP